MDISKEVFSVIFEEIIKRNSFCCESKETVACIEANVTEKKKAVFIFHHINTERDVIAKEEILKKSQNQEDSVE